MRRLILLLALCGRYVLGAVTVVANTGHANSPTSAINTTGATIIWVGTSGLGACQVADSQSNIWTVAVSIGSGASGNTCLNYCVNPTTASSHTFSSTVASVSIYVLALSGTATTGTVTVTNHSSAAASEPVSTGSISPANTGDAVVSLLGLGTGTGTISVSFGSITNQIAPSPTYGGAMAWGTALGGSVTQTFSYTSGTAGAVIASFPAASSSTSVIPWIAWNRPLTIGGWYR